MTTTSIVSLDIGGTKINAGLFCQGKIQVSKKFSFNAHATSSEIFDFIVTCIQQFKQVNTQAIAIGVPCIVDTKQGIVFDAVNIPAWQQQPLKAQLEQHFSLPVYINNDVNCFTFGEYKANFSDNTQDMLGLCLGTGFGAGIVLNKQLYHGHNCSAGEVGSIDYLDATIDDYCSGQFFKNHYHASGNELALRAQQGDKQALLAFELFGQHLAKAIANLILIIDPQLIIIGGSVANSFALFIEPLWQELKKFPYKKVIANLTIKQSQQSDSALLGAAYLFLEQQSIEQQSLDQKNLEQQK